MSCDINRPILDRGAGGILPEKVVVFPIFQGSDGPWYKASAAVRADIAQDLIDVESTERTFVCADACFSRVRWQRLVAVLAGGSEFQHE